MKKILLLSLVFLIVFVIYYFNADKKTYYLSIGDYLSYGIDNFDNINGYSENIKNNYKNNLKNYVNYSTYDDYRVMDLINDINYNKELKYNNKEYKLQNLLIKANLITLSIGMNDLIYKKNIDYDYVDSLLDDIDKLFILIRKYNKDQIYFLSFYDVINNPNLILYTNKKLESLCIKNNIKYVDISNLNNYIINKYPTKEGYMYITDRVLNFTK
jgi:hypothetical protein